MSVWLWVAAAWLGATSIITVLIFSAKRSVRMYRLLFGDKPSAEVRRLGTAAVKSVPETVTRLAA